MHINHPILGLHKAWERLEEHYGALEVIEKSLFSRIENFPKIGNTDPGKLRELGDLLQELESAKSEGYLSGLTYKRSGSHKAPPARQ